MLSNDVFPSMVPCVVGQACTHVISNRITVLLFGFKSICETNKFPLLRFPMLCWCFLTAYTCTSRGTHTWKHTDTRNCWIDNYLFTSSFIQAVSLWWHYWRWDEVNLVDTGQITFLLLCITFIYREKFHSDLRSLLQRCSDQQFG